MRRSLPSWPTKNTIWHASWGAGDRPFGPRMPKVEYSTQDFYRAQNIWRTMPDDLQDLTYVVYGAQWERNGKPIWQAQADALGMSKSTYFRELHSLHLYTEERL